MRIAVSAFGSEGDIRPFVALTKRLIAEGEDAFLVAPQFFHERAREHGVPVVASGPWLDPRSGADVSERVMKYKNPFRQTEELFAFLAPHLLASVPYLRKAFEGIDVLVHHHVDVAAFAVGEAMGIPRVAVELFHSTLPMSRELPNGISLGKTLNLQASRFAAWMFTRVTDHSFAPILEAAGVPSRKGIFLASGESARRALLAVSPSFLPTDPAWPKNTVQTGYFFLQAPDYSPPEDLTAFLQAGPPPVAVTFGSMTGTDRVAVAQMLIEATRRAGQRLLLQAGWGELGEGVALPAHVHRIGYVPHDWLFPRAALVLHHGGAGTTAAVLRAGVPQIIAWHLGDQPMWGYLAKKAGVAPAGPQWHRKVTVPWLTRAIEMTLSDERVRHRAQALGEKIRAEDGTGNAVKVIREVARETPQA